MSIKSMIESLMIRYYQWKIKRQIRHWNNINNGAFPHHYEQGE